MILKKHHTSDGRVILAVCDKELLGSSFEADGIVLDLSGDFFDGDDTNDEELEKYSEQAYVINAVGKKSVKFFTDRNYIDNGRVLEVKGVPNVHIVQE